MKQSQELKVKIQTMSRSEYVEAKHLPNALPDALIRNHQESLAVPITKKFQIAKPQRIETNETFEIITNVRPRVEDTLPIAEKNPQPKKAEPEDRYIPKRREEKAVRSGREDPPARETSQEPPKQFVQEPPRQYRYEPPQRIVEDPSKKQQPQPQPQQQQQILPQQPIRDDTELKRLRAENDDLRKKLNDCLQGKGDCENKCTKIKLEKEDLEKKLLAKPDPSHPMIQALQDEIYAIGKKLGEANQANKQLKDENEALQKQIKETPPPADPEEKLRFLANIVLLASEVERLHNVIRSLLQEKDEADQEIDRLTDLLTEKDLRIVMLSGELERLGKLVERLQPVEEINETLNIRITQLNIELQMYKDKAEAPDLLELIRRGYGSMVKGMKPVPYQRGEQIQLRKGECCEMHEKIRDLSTQLKVYEDRTSGFMEEMEKIQSAVVQMGAKLPTRTTISLSQSEKTS